MLQRAIELAESIHAGQKYRDEPYIEHIKRVADGVAKLTSDPLAIVVAILHDSVEDSDLTIDQIEVEFGKEVAADVKALTKQNNEDYQDYIARVAQRHRARLVKIADLQDNIAHASLPDSSKRVQDLLPRYYRALEFLLPKD